MGTFRAPVDLEFLSYVEQGDEVYHEVVLYEGETFDIELETEEEDEVDLDLYITDDEGTVLYKDEEIDPDEAGTFRPKTDGVYRFFVKAMDGESEYALRIIERE
jgi:hypothetical protein